MASPSPPVSTVPRDLEAAIQNASTSYGVPKDLLEGIWRTESGSTYPNRAVNSSGYGGLFGTKDWNGPPQEQANLAASVLQTGLLTYRGNISEALSYYNTGKPSGGYTSVPGETTYGTLGGSAFNNLVTAKLHSSSPSTQVSSAAGAVTGAVSSALHPFASVADALNFIFSFRFLEIVGGGLLLLLGLYLLARQLGVSVPKPPLASAAASVVP